MSLGYVPEPSTSLRFTGFGATWQFGCPGWQKHGGGSMAFNLGCLSALDSLLNPNWLQESVDSQSSSSTTPKLSFHEQSLQFYSLSSAFTSQNRQNFRTTQLATAKAPHACALAWTANVHWELSAELLQNVVILTEQCKLWKHTWMPNCKHLKM